MKNGLSVQQLSFLQNTLVPYAPHIMSVGLFGSRATGNFRPNSDIDLVIYGTIDAPSLARLSTLLNDGGLAVPVDIHAYHLIDYAPLKSHIDAVMHPLFAQHDLLKHTV